MEAARLTAAAVVSSTSVPGGLRLEPAERCETCRGTCLFSRAAGSQAALRLAVDADLHPGERVEVMLPARDLLGAAALVHGLPWAGLVAGGLLGQALTGADAGCLAGMAVGTALAFAAVRRVRSRLEAGLIARLEVRRV